MFSGLYFYTVPPPARWPAGVGVLEPGQVSSQLLSGGDIRTDIPEYRVYERGKLVSSPTDVVDIWDEHMVGFIIGCSFTFETPLLADGIKLANHLAVPGSAWCSHSCGQPGRNRHH